MRHFWDQLIEGCRSNIPVAQLKGPYYLGYLHQQNAMCRPNVKASQTLSVHINTLNSSQSEKDDKLKIN